MNKIQKHQIFGLVTLGLFVGLIPTLVTQSTPYPSYTIPEIQGDGWSTPYPWTYVNTTGIVTADFQAKSKRGFFLQDPFGDGNAATSDGIFVYERYKQVNVGDEIILVGRAREYYGLTEIDRVVAITVLSTGNPLPMPIELDPPFDDYASNVYFEALEGMLVTVPDLKMVAGTNQYGEIAGVLEDLDIERKFQDDRAGTGDLIFADDAGGVRLDVKTGDLVKGLYGPLDYTYDEYKVLPPYHAPQQPIVIRKGHDDPRIPRGRGRDGLSIATYNMYNLFDNINDTKKDDPIYSYWTMKRLLSKHANAIYDNLRLPDLIAVQEVEKLELLEALADTPPIPKDYYGAVLIDGPDTRGIDVGLLYRTDRVEILEYYARQTCTNLNDSYGPGVDPNYPCPPLTNPLFSRPPLVVHLKILDKNSDKWKGHHNHNDDDDRKPMDLWLIINHFKSKGVYPPYYADTTPRRLEQAAFVGSLVDEIQITDPDALVLVLGDLNDFENSAPLATLEARGLRNLIYEVEKEDRYTYIYRGVSEVLDHMLVTPSMEDAVDDVIVIHFNPDFPYAEYRYEWDTGIWSSDHDVLMVSIELDELDDDHDD